MKIISLISFLVICLISCNTVKSPFGKRSAHEKYGHKITEAGLKATQLGSSWFSAASNSLTQPNQVTLPFKETGFFPAEKPSAAGYVFAVRRGQDVSVRISTVPTAGVLYFADLWQSEAGKTSLLTTMDTLTQEVRHTAKRDGQYLLRIQPELLRSLEYTVTITFGPSLAFPVDSSGNPQFISFWGAGRDAGTRTHEGVDIKAKFRTPALAATNGVARVMNNNLGGKVVFVYDGSSGNSLYYAHLDSQLVRSGETVTRGEAVGLVGNTGNAISTPPHLHFGIYTNGGPIDPLAFINPKTEKPRAVTAPTNRINSWMRTTSPAGVYAGPSTESTKNLELKSGSPLLVKAASDSWYRILLPDGKEGYVAERLLTTKKIRSASIRTAARLLDSANIDSPAKTTMEKGIAVNLIGAYEDFYFVENNGQSGWISKTAID